MIDDKKMIGNRKVNYFTQVLRQIEKIDRDFAKEQKRRKLGFKQEAMEIVDRAVEQTASAGMTSNEGAAPHPLMGEPDDVSTDKEEREYRDTMKRLGITDQNRIKEESDIGRQTPIESQNASGPPDMIILQVAGEAVEMGEDPRKSR